MELSKIYKEEIEGTKEANTGSWHSIGFGQGIAHALDALTPQIATDFGRWITEFEFYHVGYAPCWNSKSKEYLEAIFNDEELFEEFLKQYKPKI